MEYYAPPEGSERVLHSRIRRCYIALAELQSAVEYLYNSTAHLNEDYTVDDVNRMYEMSREAARDFTDTADLSVFDDEHGVQRAQEQLLATPIIAEDICQSLDYVQYGAKSVIRNVEYQLDAGYFTQRDDIYQTLREKAISILGLTALIKDAIDEGFIIDARTYKETGR